MSERLQERYRNNTANKEGASSADNSKLCERILQKAEEDNVAFRTQIQKLEDEKEDIKRTAELKQKSYEKCMEQMKNI